MLLRRAGVKPRFEPIPSADEIAEAQDARLLTELSGTTGGDQHGSDGEHAVDERALRVATRLVETGNAERALARLIAATRRGATCAPREITRFEPSRKPEHAPAGKFTRNHRARDTVRGGRPKDAPPRKVNAHDPQHGRTNDAPRAFRPQAAPQGAPDRMQRSDGWVQFRVSWGQEQGADARRLLPMLCRRGNIRGTDIGAIDLRPSFSVVEVATRVAADFERATRRPDPRDPAILVRRESPSFGLSNRAPAGRQRPS
jgi:ATP-dependent RNA helicase DeaD